MWQPMNLRDVVVGSFGGNNGGVIHGPVIDHHASESPFSLAIGVKRSQV